MRTRNCERASVAVDRAVHRPPGGAPISVSLRIRYRGDRELRRWNLYVDSNFCEDQDFAYIVLRTFLVELKVNSYHIYVIANAIVSVCKW